MQKTTKITANKYDPCSFLPVTVGTLYFYSTLFDSKTITKYIKSLEIVGNRFEYLHMCNKAAAETQIMEEVLFGVVPITLVTLLDKWKVRMSTELSI